MKYAWRFLFCMLSIFLLLIQTSKVAGAATSVYTALGDSLAYGSGAPFNNYMFSYVSTYHKYLETDLGTNMVLVNIGVRGAKSADLLNSLKTNQGYRDLISASQVITWDIGGNDLISGLGARGQYLAKTCGGADNQDCFRNDVATFKANWSGIIAELLSLRDISKTIIRTGNFYYPWVNEDKATDTWPNDAGSDWDVIRPYIEDVNKYIATTSASANIPYANISLVFNGACGCEDPGDKGFISPDGLHAGYLGHKVIADLLRALGYAPLR